MFSIEISQAASQISELFDLALNGEDVIITNNQKPILKLSRLKSTPQLPLKSTSQRPPLFGIDKGLIYIADDFDVPEDFPTD